MERVGSDKIAVLFSEIDHHTALQNVTLRAARETESDLEVPKKKGLVMRSTTSKQPIKIASIPLDAEFIVTASRVKVEFRGTDADHADSLRGLAFEAAKM